MSRLAPWKVRTEGPVTRLGRSLAIGILSVGGAAAVIGFVAAGGDTESRLRVGGLSAAAVGVLSFPIVVAVFRTVDTRARRARGLPSKPLFGWVEAERSVHVAADVSTAFDRARAAVLALPGVVEVEPDIDGLVIQASTGPSDRSFGEVVTVEVFEQSPQDSAVVIRSAPSRRVTIADYGKNEDNVAQVFEALTRNEG